MAFSNWNDPNAHISTGNVRTTVDLFVATSAAGQGPVVNNNARNTLGTPYLDNVVSAAFPNGVPTRYRYVRYNSTANPALQANPAAVYWTDASFTTVSGKLSEAWSGMGQSAFAGLLMVNTTDLPNMTAALLNGNFCWIAVAGYVKAVVSAAAAAGDQLYATQADWTTTGGFSKVVVGGATVGRIAAFAAAASPSDVWVYAESL